MATKKQLEANYKSEAIGCIIAGALGWLFFGIILEPIVLWRSIYVMKRTKSAETHSLAMWGCVIASIYLAILVIALLIMLSIY